MAKLIIDNREIEVTPGTKVITAAERLGITIPRFCFHPALGSVGACRVCAVNVIEGPAQGIQMSCMLDARDGMVVSTTDKDAVDFRRYVIEWLMLHHPHDCPVCDEGGHCLLQDMTVAGGHGLRRYRGRKRTHTDQDLGPLIDHEMNRCIQCYRCVRYYREYAGYPDLGVMGIGSRVYFGRFSSGTLESPFAGNLIDVCPTGVYTDRPSRYSGRRWDFERTASLCIHCSLGCGITVDARYREVVRQEARHSPQVNGYFICDRGRYGFPYANLSTRPRQAQIDGNPVSRDRAIAAAVGAMARIREAYGPGTVAVVGSMRSNLETLGRVKHLCSQEGWLGPVMWADRAEGRSVAAALDGFDSEGTVSLEETAGADLVIGIGVDPVNEAPMLAMTLRQAYRNGASVFLIDPRPLTAPFGFTHFPVGPDTADPLLNGLIEAVGTPFEESLPGGRSSGLPDPEKILLMETGLRNSRRPVIVCGIPASDPATIGLAAKLAESLGAAGKAAGLFFVWPGANAFAAGLLAAGAPTWEEILPAIESGEVRALILTEADPIARFPDPARIAAAFERLELLVVLDHVATPATARGAIFLPTATVYEAGGVYVNGEGRAQEADPVFRGGTPIRETGRGGHPPRLFREDIPGSAPKPAWEILGEIFQTAGGTALPPGRKGVLSELARFHPALAAVPPPGGMPEGGVRLPVKAGPRPQDLAESETGSVKRPGPEGNLRLLLVDWTFGTEELSGRSPALQKVEGEPHLTLHGEDAAEMGLSDGDRVGLTCHGGEVRVSLRVSDRMARGFLIVPRHRRLEWQRIAAEGPVVARDRIRKTG